MIKTTRTESELRNKAIDMVTRLYVYTMQADSQISTNEISILYSLLTNLFAHVDDSWEAYVSEIIESDYDINEVLLFLNQHLSPFDKARILISLVIMAKTEGDFRISEITEIMQLCKNLDMNPDGFVNLIDHFETGSSKIASVPCEHHITHVRYSLFSDFVVFGSAPSADIRFRNNQLAPYEASLFAIDRYMFLAVGVSSSVVLDGSPIKTQSISLLMPDSTISIGGTEFCYSCLSKVYEHRDINDEIVFRKTSYDFIVIKRGLWYSMRINRGSITLNGRELLVSRHYERQYQIYYDDTIQIKNYAPWNLTILIQNRSSIGLDDLIPKDLYINFHKDYFNLVRFESEESIAHVEVKGNEYFIHPPKKGWTVFLNKVKLEETSPILLNSDLITIEKRIFRINSFFDLIESPFEVQSISLIDVKHYFPDGQLALDGISWEARKGELMGILGQSGSGKSTLMKLFTGEIIPTYGQILVDGKDFHSNINYYLEFFAYVPQDDLLYSYLTVFENLWYRLRLRMPHLSEASLLQKIENILHQVNLTHQRDTKVGEFKKNNLSGGERKRLNIALELLFEPTVIICDEPTSGLSFTDAEQIVDILDSLSEQGKIVLITIHQPNSSIYRKFDKVLLMDMGGKMVFFGSPQECFDYFDEELTLLTSRKADIERKRHLMTSDYMYDVIAYPEYTENNEPVYEQINRYIQPKRKFSPEYWRDKYKRKVLFEMIHHDPRPSATPIPLNRRKREKRTLKAYLIQLHAYIRRSFKMKLRNRTNNLITFVQAPVLGLIVAFILRHTPSEGAYHYAENNNIGIYVFVSIIAFIFLGLANSIEEILDERKIILRESHMKLKLSFYQASKLITLSFFTLIQAILYQSVASLILEIRGMFLISVGYLFVAGVIGCSMGLLCSSFIREKKAIINLLPLILIPQIIFGGAVIEFERMNRNLTIYHKHPVPEIVQAIPSRWLFEGLTTAYAKHTAFHRAMNHLEDQIQNNKNDFTKGNISARDYDDFRDDIYYRRNNIARKYNPDKLVNTNLNSSVSLMDGIVLSERKTAFLSSYKPVGNKLKRTWNYNLFILLLYFIGFNTITAIKLKYFFKD